MHICIQVSIQYRSIGAVPCNVPVVGTLLELHINPIIVFNVDEFKLKFVALVVIMYICKPDEIVVVAKFNVKPEYGVITIANAVLVAVIKNAAVV